MYYLFNFIFYSIFGYIFEMIFQILIGVDPKSGFLYGPYTPIYGIGITFIYIIYNSIDKKYKHLKKYLIMFLCGFIFLTILELIGGFLLKALFEYELWYYDEVPLTFFKYTNVFVSFGWGILSILCYKFIKPLIDKLEKITPKIIIIILLIIMIIDAIISILRFI